MRSPFWSRKAPRWVCSDELVLVLEEWGRDGERGAMGSYGAWVVCRVQDACNRDRRTQPKKRMN